MKKLLTLILMFTCLLGLTACGEKLEEPTELNLKFSSGETLEAPPELRIVADDGSVTASKGTFSWGYDNGLNWTGIEACGLHPLDCKDFVETLTTDDGEVRLEFDVAPHSVDAVKCWSDEHWGNTDAQSETVGLLAVNDTLNVPLKPGGWVYLVKAEWESTDYSGDCRYIFHVVCPE